MHLSVNLFTAAAPANVLKFAQAVEKLGYDQLDFGEHVTVARPAEGRAADSPAMSILEPLVTLAAVASVTARIRLGTGVLVLPQRQPALVAKQVATLDLISGGRIRLGIGVGWQEAEFDSLGVPFAERGQRMDECIELLRLYWTQSSVTFHGRFYRAEAMSTDPPPVQAGGPPIWIGGGSDAALRRIGRVGDGWLAVGETSETAAEKIALIRTSAERAGRDPAAIGLQILLTDVSSADAVVRQAAALQPLGFDWLSLALPDTLSTDRDFESVQELLFQVKQRVGRGL